LFISFLLLINLRGAQFPNKIYRFRLRWLEDAENDLPELNDEEAKENDITEWVFTVKKTKICLGP
jgi:hypothetical protein